MSIQSNRSSLLQQGAIVTLLFFFMLLTRGSHALSSVALPDASLAVFLLGGIFLHRTIWFVLLFLAAATIDFGAAAANSYFAFCLTEAYWGLIPAYGTMWLGGSWLARQADPFAISRYLPITLLTTLLAFVISTQTYYLFSGRFPSHNLYETIQHGWNYLPSYMGYTMIYFSMIWSGTQCLRHLRLWRNLDA